jgi:hypothetical protein
VLKIRLVFKEERNEDLSTEQKDLNKNNNIVFFAR